jgi:hypothetical protein
MKKSLRELQHQAGSVPHAKEGVVKTVLALLNGTR